MVDSLEEIAYGKEYARANKSFKDQINNLDEKYPNVLEKDDTFSNYLITTMNILPGRVTFNIHDDEGKVPSHIRKEMEDIFRNHFGPKAEH